MSWFFPDRQLARDQDRAYGNAYLEFAKKADLALNEGIDKAAKIKASKMKQKDKDFWVKQTLQAAEIQHIICARLANEFGRHIDMYY